MGTKYLIDQRPSLLLGPTNERELTMNIEVIKMLKGKLDEGAFTLEQIKMICPDYEKETEVLELLDNPFVKEYLRLMDEVKEHLTIPDIQRYVELTTVKTKATGGHGGTKNPMPCLICGQDSHHALWGEAKINEIEYHIGTLKSPCPKNTELRFRIPKNLTIAEMVELNFPFSEGQLGGRYKEDNKKK